MAKKLESGIRKAQIVEVALDILAREGAKGLGVAAIARRVGIVPSAIYRHYPGKEAIVDAVLDSIRDRLAENVDHARRFFEDPLERLESLIAAHTRLVRANRGFARLLFSGELFDGSPVRRAKLLGMIRAYLGEVARIVEEGRKSGRLRDDVEPSTVTLLYLGMIQPAALLWHLSDGEYDVTREVGRAWALVRKGLVK